MQMNDQQREPRQRNPPRMKRGKAGCRDNPQRNRSQTGAFDRKRTQSDGQTRKTPFLRRSDRTNLASHGAWGTRWRMPAARLRGAASADRFEIVVAIAARGRTVASDRRGQHRGIDFPGAVVARTGSVTIAAWLAP